MKSKLIIALACLLIGSASATPTAKEVLIKISVTELSSGKVITCPAVVTADSTEARICIGDSGASAVDLSVSPKLSDEQITLTVKSFSKDGQGKEQVMNLPNVISNLGSPVSLRVAGREYRFETSRFEGGQVKKS